MLPIHLLCHLCTLSCSWQWFSHSQFEVNCQCQDHKMLLSFAMAKACQKLFNNNIQSSWLVVAFSFQQFYPSHPLRSIFLKLLDISNISDNISDISQNERCLLSQLYPATNRMRVLKGESRVHHTPVLHVYFLSNLTFCRIKVMIRNTLAFSNAVPYWAKILKSIFSRTKCLESFPIKGRVSQFSMDIIYGGK